MKFATLRFASLFTVSLLTTVGFAPDAVQAETGDTAPGDGDFIRYVESDPAKQELQTAIVRYRRGDQIVDLVGVVHLADAEYFDALNTQLAQYDVVLYEMVGGEFSKRDLNADEADPALAQVSATHGIVHRLLGMEYQTEGIDYSPSHFVHADVNWDQYQELMTARNQSLMTLFQRAMASAESEDAPDILTDEAAANRMLSGLMAGFASGNTAELKRSMAPLLGEAEALITQIEGDDGTVIVTERNKIAMGVLDRELKKGHEQVAIFYGAGHLPDLEQRLAAAGFQRDTGVWMTAWEIRDPAPGETGGNLWQNLFSDPELMQGLMEQVQEGLRQLQEGGQLDLGQ